MILEGIIVIGVISAAVVIWRAKNRSMEPRQESAEVGAAIEQPAVDETVILEMTQSGAEILADETSSALQPEAVIPRIIIPASVKASEPFEVRTENLVAGSRVLADKKYPVGRIDASGVLVISLGVTGERTIDVAVGDDWVSSKITVM